MERTKAWILSAVCAAEAAWAWVLVQKHHQAAAKLMAPDLLCGEGAGCSDVLASEYATLLGFPVSLPAIPLFAALAVVAVMAARGVVSASRAATASGISAIVGLLFGGWLLYHMAFTIEAACTYCLILDALTLTVLGLSVWLHPDRLGGILRESTALAASPAGVAVALSVAIGTPALQAITRPSVEPAAVEVVTEPSHPAKTPNSAASAVATTPSKTRATKRLILPADRTPITLNPSIPVRGPADAAVTVVLFEDFQCPYCSRLAGFVEGLQEAKPDDVRVAFVHFPMDKACNSADIARSMHPKACDAAKAAVCAHQQDRFWPMHDRLFLNNRHLERDDLVGYAGELSLDIPRFEACLDDPATVEKIKADTQIGADAGVKGTPTFFLNGRRMHGGQPTEVLIAAVDVEMSGREGRIMEEVTLNGEIVGTVTAPPQVAVKAGDMQFEIDAFEAHIVDGAAVSGPGVAPARATTWYAADAACKAAGRRLCTEQEWLAACTGAAPVDANDDGVFSDDKIVGRQQPYGNYKQRGWCAEVSGPDDPIDLITGNHPKCGTPEGVYDLVGGVKEWVGLTPAQAATKGGSYLSANSGRCGYYKDQLAPDAEDETTGFRCCSGEAKLSADAQRFPGGKVGDEIQDWKILRLEGGMLDAASLRGKPYVMTFWATWCGPCRKELAALTELYPQVHDELEIVAVSIDHDLTAIKRYVQHSPLPFPIVVDPSQAWMARFDTRGVPTAFWVTKSGRIRQRTIGFDTRGIDQLKEDLDALVAAE